MLKFMLGNVRHQLDEKYRIRIPSKFKDKLGASCCYLLGREVVPGKRCIYLLPEDRAESVFETLNGGTLYGGDDVVNDASLILGNGDIVEEDPQGRTKLGKEICKAAGIFKDIVFVGKGDYVEIWAAEVWDERFSILNPDNVSKTLENLKKFGV